MFHSLLARRRGFTLIELIIVVAIIAVIAAAVFVALDPARRLNAGRNSRRWTDVTSILQAIRTFQVDSATSVLPANIDAVAASVQVIGTGVVCPATCGALTVPNPGCGANIAANLTPYLATMPFDPRDGGAADTRYYVNVDANGIVTVGVCLAQGEGAGGGAPIPPILVTQ